LEKVRIASVPGRVREVGAARILDIGLVDRQHDVVAQPRDEAVERLGPDTGTGGVVWIAHQDEPGTARDRRGHRLEVVGELRVERHRNARRPRSLHDDRIHRERRPGIDDFVPFTQQDLREQLEDLVRTGTEDELLGSDREPTRERAAQLVARTIGIAVDVRGLRAHRLHGLRGRTERVLVRGQLDRAADAELALQLLDRLARLIRLECRDVGSDPLLEGHG
jgi:hypothetical protein